MKFNFCRKVSVYDFFFFGLGGNNLLDVHVWKYDRSKPTECAHKKRLQDDIIAGR